MRRFNDQAIGGSVDTSELDLKFARGEVTPPSRRIGLAPVGYSATITTLKSSMPWTVVDALVSDMFVLLRM